MLGKWDDWYRDVDAVRHCGGIQTYKLAADFLKDMSTVEDWGCGAGGFRKFYKGKYKGIDGSANKYVDKVADLRTYRSSVDGILVRHVLEHNYN